MELSERERAIILALRETVEAEVRTLTDYIQQAEEFRYELTSTNRTLEMENRALIDAVNEHGICVLLPCTQYTGTP
jgi:hypothetical protein